MQQESFTEIIVDQTKRALWEAGNVIACVPEGCEYAGFTLILAQHRHLHTHMGMLMGFIVAETGLWPGVLGLEGTVPEDGKDKYFM